MAGNKNLRKNLNPQSPPRNTRLRQLNNNLREAMIKMNINKKIIIPALCVFLIGSGCVQKGTEAKGNIKDKPKTSITTKSNEDKKKESEKMRTNINKFSGESFAELFEYEQKRNPEKSMIKTKSQTHDFNRK